MSHSAARAGRGGKVAAVTLAGILLMAPALPWLLSQPPLRDWALGRVLAGVRGTVTARSASFSWYQPTRIEGLTITGPDGQPALELEAFEAEASLYQLLFPGENLGRITLRKPTLHVVITPQGSSLQDVLPEVAPPAPASESGPKSGYQIEVVEGRVVWRFAHSSESWEVKPIDLKLRVVTASESDDGVAALIVERALVLDQAPLTPEMSRDLLVYAAPALADALVTSGQVSLALEGGHFPLHDWSLGELQGSVIFHSAEIGPGKLVRQLTDLFQLPTVVELTRDTLVPFVLRDRRVEHRDFDLGLGPLRVETCGSVGLDQSLDLVARLQWRMPLELILQRPLLRAFSQHGLSLPIRGTLQEPVLDTEALGQNSLSLLATAFENLRGNRPEGVSTQTARPLVELLERQPPPGAPNPDGAAAPGEVNVPAVISDAAKALIELRRQRLEQRKVAEQSQPAPANPEAPNASPPSPAKRPLGRLLDRLKNPPPASESPAPQPPGSD